MNRRFLGWGLLLCTGGQALVGCDAGSKPSGAGGNPGLGANATLLRDCSITAETHWAAGQYVARCNVDVASHLIVEPGTIVKFAPGFHVTVRPQGKLTAEGTAEHPIVFTSLKDDARGGDAGGDGPTVAARNDWGCSGACVDVALGGSGSSLANVQVLYGTSGVAVQAGDVAIASSTVAHQGGDGLLLDERYPVETSMLSGNAFFDNGGFPLRLGKVITLNDSNVFNDPDHPDTKNGKQCIELRGDLDRLAWLGVLELGFLFGGPTKISAEVLVPPGVVFKAKGDKISLTPTGNFVNGTGPIFTSYKDDAQGGDCTGDGPSAPATGDWDGLWIDDGSKADYAAPADEIRYAAHGGTMPLH